MATLVLPIARWDGPRQRATITSLRLVCGRNSNVVPVRDQLRADAAARVAAGVGSRLHAADVCSSTAAKHQKNSPSVDRGAPSIIDRHRASTLSCGERTPHDASTSRACSLPPNAGRQHGPQHLREVGHEQAQHYCCAPQPIASDR